MNEVLTTLYKLKYPVQVFMNAEEEVLKFRVVANRSRDLWIMEDLVIDAAFMY